MLLGVVLISYSSITVLFRWNMFPRQTGRISYFWKGVLSCLPAFRGYVLHEVSSGTETLLWKDSWFAGRAPMFIWPEEFKRASEPNGTVCEMGYLLNQASFSGEEDSRYYRARLTDFDGAAGDRKRWRLKSFYTFLIDGGVHYPIARFFWRKPCPKKVSLFNWLAEKNKILTMDVLARRSYNRLPTTTCVLCNSALESPDHLFLHCLVARKVWGYFVHLLHLPDPPGSMQEIWRGWRTSIRANFREIGGLVAKAIVWNIRLVRNDCIFNANYLSTHALVLKIDRILISWLSSVVEGSREMMEDPIAMFRQSTEALGISGVVYGGDPLAGVDQDLLSD
ncbi:uncharacterized protein LOC120274920 [Dioscorea cayenensis subsp. rotundata]|uniref:Uncharacterized protein LOC120274920 n=1 Tax=Dioscorea cayennensis subsp. rotundata TaxID=55577 RepID=A0AB40CC10_DIOCR|nr:uncharacterized protein LOC120274920 [Dioscorea cayenensis subsp. rotundata]